MGQNAPTAPTQPGLVTTDYHVTLAGGKTMDIRVFRTPEGQGVGLSEISGGQTVRRLNFEDYPNYHFTAKGAYAYDPATNNFRPAGPILGSTDPQPLVQSSTYPQVRLPNGQETSITKFELIDGKRTHEFGYSQTMQGKSGLVDINKVAPDYDFTDIGAYNADYQPAGAILPRAPASGTPGTIVTPSASPAAPAQSSSTIDFTPVAGQSRPAMKVVQLGDKEGTQLVAVFAPDGERVMGFRDMAGKETDLTRAFGEKIKSFQDNVFYDDDFNPIGKLTGFNVAQPNQIPNQIPARPIDNDILFGDMGRLQPIAGEGSLQYQIYQLQDGRAVYAKLSPDGQRVLGFVDENKKPAAWVNDALKDVETVDNGVLYNSNGEPIAKVVGQPESRTGTPTANPATDPKTPPQKPGAFHGIKQNPGRFALTMGIGLFTAGWMGYERFKQGAKYGQVLAESIPAIIGLAVGLNQVVHLNMGMSFGIAAGAVALLLAILQQMVQPSDKALDPTDPQNIAYSRPITMPQATGPWDSLVPEGTVIPILATVTAIAVGSMSLDFTKQKGETYSFAAGVLPAVTQKLRESSKPFSGDDLIGRSFLKRTDKDHIAYVTRQTRVNNQGELETSYKLNHRTLNSNGYEIIPGKPTAMNSFFLVDWINKTIHPREDASSDLDTQTTMSNLSNSSAVSADGAVGALRLGASQGHGGGE